MYKTLKNTRYLELTARLLDLQSETSSEPAADPECRKSIHVSLNQVIDGTFMPCFIIIACFSETIHAILVFCFFFTEPLLLDFVLIIFFLVESGN